MLYRSEHRLPLMTPYESLYSIENEIISTSNKEKIVLRVEYVLVTFVISSQTRAVSSEVQTQLADTNASMGPTLRPYTRGKHMRPSQ